MSDRRLRARTVRPDHFDKLRESTHVLYRCFNRKKRLLYVGMTNNPEDRFKHHRANKPWWKYVDHITLQELPTRKALIAAESIAIQTENPKFNAVYPVGIDVNLGKKKAHRLWPEVSGFSTYIPDHGLLIDQTLEQQLYPCTECKARAIKCVGDTVMCELCAAEWPYEQWFSMTFVSGAEQLRLPI